MNRNIKFKGCRNPAGSADCLTAHHDAQPKTENASLAPDVNPPRAPQQPPTPPDPDEWLTLGEVAAILKAARTTIWRKRQDGLRQSRMGGIVRVQRRDLDAYFRSKMR